MSNKFTGAFKEAVQIVYQRLGGHAAFLEWARENRTEYYRIAARLIPGEAREGPEAEHVTIIVQRYSQDPTVIPGTAHEIEDHASRSEEE